MTRVWVHTGGTVLVRLCPQTTLMRRAEDGVWELVRVRNLIPSRNGWREVSIRSLRLEEGELRVTG